jgi:hypothetical protein
VAGDKVEAAAKTGVRSEAETVISNGCGCGDQKGNGSQVRGDGGGCCQQKAVTTTADVEVEAVTEPCDCG